MNNFDHLYTEFNQANPELIHMAAHSHHYWPDITREAIEEAYQDAMSLVDLKWNKIFSEVVPLTQKLMSKILHFSRPADIAFAPNTHELLVRMISSLPTHKKKRILTTKHEFHSANRQFQRLNEEEDYEIDFVESNELVSSIRKYNYDMIYVSHVFFDSGFILEDKVIEDIIKYKEHALFLLDGYHSFCAIEVDLSKWEDELFYLSGSYKYVQAGEGLCFMTMPKECKLRPRNTGWFASFDTLESPAQRVEYSDNGYRMSGATRDFTPHYRFNKVWNSFFEQEINIKVIDSYIKNLQQQFLDALKDHQSILCTDLTKIGHFITFKTNSHAHSKEIYEKLLAQDILTDFRGNSLRFGFGMHMNSQKIKILVEKMKNIEFFS